MLTKDQEFMIEVIDKIQDLELKREYLLKLKSSLKDEPEKEKEIISSQSQMYNIQDIIFNKYEKIKPREITNSELQLEIKQIKLELSQLKIEQQEMKEQMQTLKHETSEKSSSEIERKPEENTQEYMIALIEVSIQRYLIKINVFIHNEF